MEYWYAMTLNKIYGTHYYPTGKINTSMDALISSLSYNNISNMTNAAQNVQNALAEEKNRRANFDNYQNAKKRIRENYKKSIQQEREKKIYAMKYGTDYRGVMITEIIKANPAGMKIEDIREILSESDLPDIPEQEELNDILESFVQNEVLELKSDGVYTCLNPLMHPDEPIIIKQYPASDEQHGLISFIGTPDADFKENILKYSLEILSIRPVDALSILENYSTGDGERMYGDTRFKHYTREQFENPPESEISGHVSIVRQVLITMERHGIIKKIEECKTPLKYLNNTFYGPVI